MSYYSPPVPRARAPSICTHHKQRAGTRSHQHNWQSQWDFITLTDSPMWSSQWGSREREREHSQTQAESEPLKILWGISVNSLSVLQTLSEVILQCALLLGIAALSCLEIYGSCRSGFDTISKLPILLHIMSQSHKKESAVEPFTYGTRQTKHTDVEGANRTWSATVTVTHWVEPRETGLNTCSHSS